MLKGKHQIRQFANFKLFSVFKLAKAVILAINTAHIAMIEKDCAGTAGSGYGRLFAKMQMRGANLCPGTGPAESGGGFISVNAAFTRTYRAILK